MDKQYFVHESSYVDEGCSIPGTTEKLLKPILEQGSGLKCGEDV